VPRGGTVALLKGRPMSDNRDAAHDDPDGPAGPLMLTPRRPGEVPHGREMSTLLDDFHHVYWQMLEQRRGFVDPLPADLRVSTGLAELALGAVLIDRLQSLRWQTMVDVLAAGGTWGECTAAMGLTEQPPQSVTTRLQAWATAQREHGLLSDDDHRRIVELAASAGAAEQLQRAKHVQRTSDQQETDRG
jgi:hypothetical protein